MMAPRADTLLAERGLFESRAKAREAIEAGLVRADGRLVRKPSEDIATNAELSARAPYPWVSRGGVKLAHALKVFGVDPRGRYCLDVGASTGGFTDVLLSRGAGHVVAVDVGHGQLHRRIRSDPRVTALERHDARALEPKHLGKPPDLIVCDASFISLTLILPNVSALAAPDAMLIALIKPQFEAGRGAVKKGLVRDTLVHEQVCARVAREVERLGWRLRGLCPSPIEGGDGNREFLLCGQKS
jgi:23S rRNA (cytidine1920-2'-O)/16S rRNA (cytidine1409-2'-O)-methyltransferase